MNHMEFALLMTEEIAFIKEKKKEQGLTTPELAALSNLTVNTVVNLLEGRTFSPHHRTVLSLFHGLGYELALPTGKKVLRYKAKVNKKRKEAV